MPSAARLTDRTARKRSTHPEAATPPPQECGPSRPADGFPVDTQRVHILNAAAAQFAQHGYAGASLRHIAQSAGLSHAMIRHLIGDKDALWDATADHLFAPLWAALMAAMAGVDTNDPVQRMEAQVRACVRAASQAPFLAGFVMQAGLAGGPRYDALVEHKLRPLYALALEPFRKLTAGAGNVDISAHFVFLVVTNAAINPFAQSANSKALAGLDLHDLSVADAYAETLIAILKHGFLRNFPPKAQSLTGPEAPTCP